MYKTYNKILIEQFKKLPVKQKLDVLRWIADKTNLPIETHKMLLNIFGLFLEDPKNIKFIEFLLNIKINS